MDFFLISYCKSLRTFASGLRQQHSVSTKAVGHGTAVHGEVNDEVYGLCLFEISISLGMSYSILDYRPLSGSFDIVEGSIMQLSGFHDLVETVLICLERSEKFGAHRKRL